MVFTATRRQVIWGAKTYVLSNRRNPLVNRNFGAIDRLVTPAFNPLTSNFSSMAPYFNLDFTFDAEIFPCSKDKVGQISNFLFINGLV